MDYQIFKWIHGFSGNSDFFDTIMSIASKWGIYFFIGAILLLLIIRSTRNIGIYSVLALAAGLLVNRILKLAFDRPRPFVTHDIDILIPKEPSPSFPSDQALIAGIFLAVFWLLGHSYRWLSITLALLVIVSRVYVGHHYPGDVVVGCLVGVCVFLAVYHLVYKKRILRKPNTKKEITPM